MASQESSSTIDSMLTTLDIGRRLDDVKRRGRLVQVAAAIVLLGAATIALVVSATTAIIFAVLAVVGLWMLPSVRRTIGDTFGIRDLSGRYRVVAAATDESTFLAFLNSEGKPRLLLGTAAAGAPLLAMSDASGEWRVNVACDAASNAAVIDLLGDNEDVFQCTCKAWQ